jgi:hypothetical protein
MFDIVASDKHQLPLPVEAEGVDQAKPRLAGPSARNTQPMSEGQPVEDREHDKGGNAAGRKESDLKDPIVRERKLIQPLHAQSKTSAAKRLNEPIFNSPAERWFSLRPRSKTGRGSVIPAWRAACARRISSTRAMSHFITKCDPVENCGVHRIFARIEQPAVETRRAAHGSKRSIASESARSGSSMSTAMSLGVMILK